MRKFRRSIRSLGLALVVSCLASSVVSAQPADSSVAVTLTATGGDDQTVRVATILPTPFAVRATDEHGSPLAGLPVQFAVNSCIDAPLQPPSCPPAELYGHFASGPDGVTAMTDADGVAVANGFTAGSISGTYSVFPFIIPLEVDGIYYHVVDSQPLFHITQVGRLPSAGAVDAYGAPTLGTWQMIFAALLIAACGAWHARKSRMRRS